MTAEQKATCKKICVHYGIYHQCLKTVEELSELSQAIIKAVNDKGDYDAVVEEIADVEIMLEQIKLTLDPTGLDVLAKIRYKLARQMERIKGEESDAGNQTD